MVIGTLATVVFLSAGAAGLVVRDQPAFSWRDFSKARPTSCGRATTFSSEATLKSTLRSRVGDSSPAVLKHQQSHVSGAGQAFVHLPRGSASSSVALAVLPALSATTSYVSHQAKDLLPSHLPSLLP